MIRFFFIWESFSPYVFKIYIEKMRIHFTNEMLKVMLIGDYRFILMRHCHCYV